MPRAHANSSIMITPASAAQESSALPLQPEDLERFRATLDLLARLEVSHLGCATRSTSSGVVQPGASWKLTGGCSEASAVPAERSGSRGMAAIHLEPQPRGRAPQDNGAKT